MAFLLVAGLAGCSANSVDDGPARVAALPAGVTGLGPAVFLTEVADERRTDLLGLVAVERFGDDLAGVQPVRRHVDLALGDPLAPTVARGLAEDPRDAFLSDGRVRDIELPDRSYPRLATTVRDGLVVIGSQCLVVRDDGEVRQPAVGSHCRAGEGGGVLWNDPSDGRWGGVDVSTGAPGPGIVVPGRVLAATPDGRHLFSMEQSTEHMLIADTATGKVLRTQVPSPTRGGPQAATTRGYAFVRIAEGKRRLSLLGLDGKLRDLVAPVGEVAFTQDGSRAMVSAASNGESRLSVLDLADGTRRPLTGDQGPMRSWVEMIVTDRYALVAEMLTDDYKVPGPVRMWILDLEADRLTAVPTSITASTVRVVKDALVFLPGAEMATLSADGRAVIAPAGTRAVLPLSDGRVVHRLTEGDDVRRDRLLVAGADGSRTEIATGADDKQTISELIATPDGAHLLVSLRGSGGRSDIDGQHEIVLVRLDGAGEPVVLYRGVILASLGRTAG